MQNQIRDIIVEGVLLKCAEYGVNEEVARGVCKIAEAKILPVISQQKEKRALKIDVSLEDLKGYGRNVLGKIENALSMKDPYSLLGAGYGALAGGYGADALGAGILGTLGSTLAGGIGGLYAGSYAPASLRGIALQDRDSVTGALLGSLAGGVGAAALDANGLGTVTGALLGGAAGSYVPDAISYLHDKLKPIKDSNKKKEVNK